MSAASAPRLAELLPELYRVRDAEHGGAFAALLELLDGELDRLRLDVDALYDDAFVETCADWVVPYIGELLGVEGLRDVRGGGLTRRGLVANTIGYRRRKGTAAVLEDLARDATGWPARAVEYFALLGWTQNLNHVRPAAGGSADLRDASPLELVGGPFDPFAHTAEVRHIDNRRGTHNIPDVGIHLWRRGAYPLKRVKARAVPGSPGAYRVNPFGLDSPLHHLGAPERDVAHIATEANVPGPVRRRALRDELAGGRAIYLGEVDPALRIWIDGVEIGRERLAVCDLEPFDRPLPAGALASVDPERGRLLVPGADGDTVVEVSWAYGFAGDLGGGPYDRRESVEAIFAGPEPEAVGRPTWQRGVRRDPLAGEGEVLASVKAALAEWEESGPEDGVALIVAMDSRTYAGDLEVKIPAGATLILAAGEWPDRDPGEYSFDRRVGEIDPAGPRPHLLGNLTIETAPGPEGAERPVVILDGLAIEGTIAVAPGDLGRLRVAHCTVLPDPGGAADPVPAAIAVGSEASEDGSRANAALGVEIVRSSCGPLAASGRAGAVRISDSIVRGSRLAAAGPALDVGRLEIERSTVLGTAAAVAIEASECLFEAPVRAERRQAGCVRYSYVPPGSSVPRRFRCQPADGAARPVAPIFESVDPGEPGYGQLDPATAPEIAAGGERGGEIGAFNFVQAPHRLAQLDARLAEYVRFGLETGVFLAS